MSLNVQAVRTPIFRIGDDLTDFVLAHFPREFVRERMILAVTSKIVSLAENRLVDPASITKRELIQKDAFHLFFEVGL